MCALLCLPGSAPPQAADAAPPPLLAPPQVRHGPHLYACSLELAADGSGGHVSLDRADQGLAAGQYAAFYQDGICLGSALIAGSDAV